MTAKDPHVGPQNEMIDIRSATQFDGFEPGSPSAGVGKEGPHSPLLCVNRKTNRAKLRRFSEPLPPVLFSSSTAATRCT